MKNIKYKIIMLLTSILGVSSYFMPFFAFGSSLSHYESCSFSGLNNLIENKTVLWGNFLENGISIGVIKILGIVYAFVFVAAAIVSLLNNKKAVLACFGLMNIVIIVCIMSLMLNVPKLGSIAHVNVGSVIGVICSFILTINFLFYFMFNRKNKNVESSVESNTVTSEEPKVETKVETSEPKDPFDLG